MKQRTYAIAAAITALMIASAPAAPAQNMPEGLSGTPSKLSATGKGYEIIIIDGRVATNDDLTALNPAKITKFRLYKGYGLRKEYGIIATCTKKGPRNKGTAGPIILVNGIEIDSLQQVRQRYVRTVRAIMPEKATEIYGEQGCNGAILFTLHETCDGKPITMQEVLSGYEWGETAPAAKPAGPDTVQIRISDISSTAEQDQARRHSLGHGIQGQERPHVRHLRRHLGRRAPCHLQERAHTPTGGSRDRKKVTGNDVHYTPMAGMRCIPAISLEKRICLAQKRWPRTSRGRARPLTNTYNTD